MPITKREEARETGWAQVRAALTSFEGNVVSAEFGQWGSGKLLDESGNPLPPKEFLEIVNTNLKVLSSTEPLQMDIEGGEFTFRVNCSDYKGSFWVEDFLASADKAKLLIPDDLVGKRIVWRKVTREYVIKGREVKTVNFIIDKVKGVSIPQAEEEVPVEPTSAEDPMEVLLELAVGKTETQFRSAASLKPGLDSTIKALVKAGVITAALVKEGKLVEVQEGTKKVYRIP